MRISKNALTGNTKVLNEFEGDGVIDKVIRPERESLQSSFKSQDWLFRYEGELYAEMMAEEAAAEAAVERLMLGSASVAQQLEDGFAALED